jgi:fatty acid desaturase
VREHGRIANTPAALDRLLRKLGGEGTLSHNRALNEFLTKLLTKGGYRALHTDHHRHLSTDRDPEIVHKKASALQWDLPAPLTRILGYAVRDLAGYSIPDFWIIVTFSKPPRKADYLGLAAFHLIGTRCCFQPACGGVGTRGLLGLWKARRSPVNPPSRK